MARKSRKNIQMSDDCVKEEIRQFRAALYVRLSNEERFNGANKNSFKNQKAFLLDFVEEHSEITIYKIYEDNGATGTNFDRPGFSEMMYDVSNEKVDCIIVKDLSRFGREHVEMGKYIDYLFPMIGLRFIAINDNYDTYDKIKNNDMIVPFKNIINAVYSKDISRKVISSLSIKQHKGEFLGNYPPYGYSLDKDRRFVIDENAAEVVRRIFAMRVEGKSSNYIARTLTKEGIDTPGQYRLKNGNIKSSRIAGDGLWNASTIMAMLSNKAYIGHMVQGKTQSVFLKTGEKRNKSVNKKAWIVIENTHEAIVEKSLFEQVQNVQLIKKPDKKKTNTNENVLVGKIFCNNCGKPLVYRSKGKYRAYSCSMHAKYPDRCDFISINAKQLHDAVFKSIKTYILTAVDFDKSMDEVKNTYKIRIERQKLESIINKLKFEISTINKQRFELFRDCIDGIVEPEEFNFARESYNNSVDLLEQRLQIIESEYNRFQKRLEPCVWLEKFKRYRSSKTLTKEMIDCFINSITVGKDNVIKINWRFTVEELIAGEVEIA